ncbi:hypothetical protein SAMN05660350_05019 [Geodermatophilus obscurus]|uniref:Transmembrane protein n=1 Tax=Geodermatophilus obscurus TaxID=1861 RepID=A0A1M7V1D4_9ACTN|nr:hypothetical protein [Geodermatophilus obscurus]SHN89024.1 hypothetical protein SAMN05660350_05019 [Geodermatophilus obscurus]
MAAEVPIPPSQRIRAFTLGRGPLKRGSDRLQFAARLVLCVVVLVSVPVALAIGTVVHEQLRATAEQRAAELTPVSAVALGDAEPVQEGRFDGRYRTSVRWTARDGTDVEAVVTTLGDTSVGDTVTVWTTTDGRPTAAPPTSSEALHSTVVLVLIGWSWFLVFAGTAYAGLCWVLDRLRDRRWTRQWAEIEPTWSRRVP